MDFDPDPLAAATNAQAAELRVVGHAMGEYLRMLTECGYTRDEALWFCRDYHRTFWASALVEGYQPAAVVSEWPPPLPPANSSEF